MKITVAVPTHNRPELLQAALHSVAVQSHRDWEVVIVDDGSSPPVDDAAVRAEVGAKYQLVRHTQTLGIASAKNAGVQAARGEVVLHLDDDDLLMPEALAHIDTIFSTQPELGCLFLNVEPFGRLAEGSRINQHDALAKVLRLAEAGDMGGKAFGIIPFEQEKLFNALLNSVPIAFQRPAARRQLWQRVGLFRPGVYMPEPEWALRAALTGETALMLEPLLHWRVDGQGYVSHQENRMHQLESNIAMKQRLWSEADSLGISMKSRHDLRRGLRNIYFDKAYMSYWHGHRIDAWKALASSLAYGLSWPQTKMLARTLVPRRMSR